MKWSIPEKIIARGRRYVDEGRVLSVIPDLERQVWHAEVLGSEQYMVELDGTAKEQDSCECPYWLEHGYCKHTVAVELYLKQEGLSRILKSNATLPESRQDISLSEVFTKGLSKLMPQTPETFRPLLVEFVVDSLETNAYHSELSVLGISLKIGYLGPKKRTYIVKNIGEFFKAFEAQGQVTINRQYHFQLIHTAFAPDALAILKQCLTIYQTSQLLGVTGLAANGKLDKRYVLLPLGEGKALLEAMSTAGNFRLVDGEQVYRKLTFTQDKLPIRFQVKEHGKKYQLVIHDEITTFLKNYHWAIAFDKVFELNHQAEEIYVTMKQLLKRMDAPEIIYEKAETSDLFSTVLPLMEQIGEVQITSGVEAQVVNLPLRTKFYFRKIRQEIKLRIDFCYGEYVFSTDESKNQYTNDREVIRKQAAEAKIFKQVQALGYQSDEAGYTKPLPQAQALYQFFKQEIPIFQKLGEVLMGRKLRSLFLDAQKYQPTIEVTDAGSWLDVRFDVTGIDETEIDAMLKSLLRQDKFYTLKTGEILSFDTEAFQQTSATLLALREKWRGSDGSLKIPKSQGITVEHLLADNERAQFSESFKGMVQDLTNPAAFEVKLPAVQATLREYQVNGFRWLKMLASYQLGGILADEMGLGKTLQMITFLLSEKEEGKLTSPALIVAPASLIYNWQAEFRKFAPSMHAQVITGSKQERENLLQTNQEADVWITSYAGLRQDIDTYHANSIGYLILDEAQMVKNSGTKTAQALKQLDIPQRFALSGTPVENNLEELWSIFQLILPGFFPSRQRFRELATSEVARMIQPFILRRDKESVLQDLPEKIESNLYSALTEEQKTVYLAYLRQMQAEVQQMDGAAFQKNRIGILAGLTRLRQICCDPRLFIDQYQGGSGKVEQVKLLLETAKENNRRVLLFSQFTSMLSLLETELHEMGLDTFYLRGSTKVKDRLAMVDAFNAGQKDVFLISLKAGGTGLNLTGADTVILYDLWWNPAVEEQAAGRAHRIGQKKVVEVWRMIAEGTIEEKMDALQSEKRELFQKVIQGGDELTKLTEEDIRMILSIGE